MAYAKLTNWLTNQGLCGSALIHGCGSDIPHISSLHINGQWDRKETALVLEAIGPSPSLASDSVTLNNYSLLSWPLGPCLAQWSVWSQRTLKTLCSVSLWINDYILTKLIFTSLWKQTRGKCCQEFGLWNASLSVLSAQRERVKSKNRHLFLGLQRAFGMCVCSFLVHVSVCPLTICLPSVTGS